MFGGFLKQLFTFIFAFALGASVAQDKPAVDSELEQKVQQHMDVIVDESAAIVDDVMDEARKNENVQKAEEFVSDVNEIVDNTRQDIRDHFGPEETESLTEGDAEAVEEVPVEEAVSEAAETEISG